MNPKLTPEETRTLRREVRGKGNLSRQGLIDVTPAGRQWVAQDDERVKADRAAGGGTRYISKPRRIEIATKAGEKSAANRKKRKKGKVSL